MSTDIKSSVSPLGAFTPESVYMSKEGFLSFNKLMFSLKFFFVLFCFFRNLRSWWGENARFHLGKNVQKLTAQATCAHSQGDGGPGIGPSVEGSPTTG